MATNEVGDALREWRLRRRLTQLDLALEAGISTRHLSFVETGRSQPGRELLGRVLDRLDVPLRERNRLLLAAGHAPAFPQRPLDAAELAPVREAIDLVLSRHHPHPALAVDRHWNLVAANPAVGALFAGTGADVDPALLRPPVNVLRLGLSPAGLLSRTAEPRRWLAHFTARLERQLAAGGDAALESLLEELRGYSAQLDDPDPVDVPSPATDPPGDGPITLGLRDPDGDVLSFIAMFAAFDSPFEVTASELAIELFFPADAETAAALERLARRRRA